MDSAGNSENSDPIETEGSDISEIPNTKTKLSKSQLENLDSLNIDFQLRGWLYAYCSEGNGHESNGEWHSDNFAQQITANFPENGLYMVINDQEYVEFDSSLLGSKLYLVNTSEEIKGFVASDSRLNIVAEAKDESGEWKPITYLPASSCGNSSHIVHLDTNEYWSFDIPIFTGNFQTKLRYGIAMHDTSTIFSNEIDAYINKAQFNSKKIQGWNPINIMDPYQE